MHGCLFVEKRFKKNQIFSQESNIVEQHRLSRYIYLKKLFCEQGIDLNTQDLTKETDSDFSIYIDYSRPRSKKNYLIVNEPPTILSSNHAKKKIDQFDKVFTWNDDLVNNKNIIKYNNLNYDFNNINYIKNNAKGGYLFVISNKKSNFNKENYSKRFDIINFFENQKYDFDLYGTGWSNKTYSNVIINKLFNNRFLKFENTPPLNYKGESKNKIELGSNYLFQFAVENTKNINGYISEKIFDCFFAGSIPIYSGTLNIERYIPNELFINIENFNSMGDLINYTENLKNKEIRNYREAFTDFLSSEAKKYFDFKYNTKKLFEHIITDLKVKRK